MTDELPAKRHRGRLVDARLHLLDRQLNEHDDPVGIVDDLELSGVELDRDVADGSPAPQVTALLSGRVVATRILGGAPAVPDAANPVEVGRRGWRGGQTQADR